MFNKFLAVFCLFICCTSTLLAGDTITVSLNKEVQFTTFSPRSFRELSKQASFKEQQNPAHAGALNYKDASFRIVVIDFQRDSVFNSPYDILTLTTPDNDTVYTSFTGVSAAELRKTIYIKDAGQYFKVLEVSPKGDYVKLEVQQEKRTGALYVLKTLPNMDFELLTGVKKNFSKLIDGKRYIYIDFWATWCVPCVQAMPKLKALQKQFSSKLVIVGLNSEDTPDKALDFVKKNKLSWLQGVSSEALRKVLQVNGYPHGVLFNPQGKLVGMGFEPEDVEAYLKKH